MITQYSSDNVCSVDLGYYVWPLMSPTIRDCYWVEAIPKVDQMWVSACREPAVPKD